MNSTARIVWELLNEGYEKDEISSLFAHHFRIPAVQATEDVTLAIASLEQITQFSPTADSDAIVSPFAFQSDDCNAEILVGDVDLGVYRFGNSAIHIHSALDEINANYFSRFQHRRINTDAVDALLEISRDRLRFRGETVLVGTLTELMAATNEILFSLEHPDTEFLVYFHAAALSHGDKSLLLSGSSGKGKSTLTAYLAANGFAYLSDDLVAITEADWALRPLPNRLSLKTGSWPIMEAFYPSLPTSPQIDCHGRTARYVDPPLTKTAAPTPSVIVFPCYTANEATRLNPCPPLQAMAQLIEANVDLAKPVTEAKLGKFVRFIEKTPAYELHYSDLQSAMETLEHLLETEY